MRPTTVSKRLRELGIRVALGGQRKQVLQAALDRLSSCSLLARQQDCSLNIGEPGAGFHRGPGNPRDPLILRALF